MMRYSGLDHAMSSHDQIGGRWPEGEPDTEVEIEIDLRGAVPPWENGAMLAEARRVLEGQDEGALRIFEKMYEMSGSIPPEQLNDKRIEMYTEIIRKYPKAGLAQEAHWKLCRIYLRDYNPPKLAEAEKIYNQFATNYPTSVLVSEVQNEFIRFYSASKMWDRLLVFTATIIEKDLDNPPPFPLFYYAEANYQLERKEEAETAFVLAAKIIPKTSHLNKLALERLAKMGVPPPTPETPATLRRTISK